MANVYAQASGEVLLRGSYVAHTAHSKGLGSAHCRGFAFSCTRACVYVRCV